MDIKYEMSHWRRHGPAQHQIGGVVAISPIGALKRRFRLKSESHGRSRLHVTRRLQKSGGAGRCHLGLSAQLLTWSSIHTMTQGKEGNSVR